MDIYFRRGFYSCLRNFAFVLDFIPDVGSVISSAIPILIYLLQSGFSFLWLIFALLIVATQMLIGNIIEPKLQGVQLNLTPIMVLVSLIFWGWLWGIHEC